MTKLAYKKIQVRMINYFSNNNKKCSRITPSKHSGSNYHLVRISWEALARSRPDDSCTLACFQTGSVWPKPDTINQNQIGSRLVLHNIIQEVYG